ncbi:MAG: Lrp/AsnC family transcriptional regulator [Thermoprotei archaeon]|nr:Lrp/AsnC family transcriptional regulator [Thermoprotei archaeon]
MPKKREIEEIVLEDVDLKIIEALASNSRSSLKEISEIVGIPISTAFSRIRRLEQLGIIKGYTLNVDQEKLGYKITAIIHFSVDGPYLEEIEKQIASKPNVIFLYDITGEFDIIAVARFKDIEELDKFVKETLKNPHIKRTTTSIALRVVKESYPHVPI